MSSSWQGRDGHGDKGEGEAILYMYCNVAAPELKGCRESIRSGRKEYRYARKGTSRVNDGSEEAEGNEIESDENKRVRGGV